MRKTSSEVIQNMQLRMDLDPLARFLLLGFSCCSCNSERGPLRRGKMQNQLLSPWELCRWLSYSSSNKRKSNSLKTPRQRMLPGNRLTRSLGTLAEAEALWSASRRCAHERKSDIRLSPKLEPFPSFSGWPTGRRAEARSTWLDTSVLGSPIRWLKRNSNPPSHCLLPRDGRQLGGNPWPQANRREQRN